MPGTEQSSTAYKNNRKHKELENKLQILKSNWQDKIHSISHPSLDHHLLIYESCKLLNQNMLYDEH